MLRKAFVGDGHTVPFHEASLTRVHPDLVLRLGPKVCFKKTTYFYWLV